MTEDDAEDRDATQAIDVRAINAMGEMSRRGHDSGDMSSAPQRRFPQKRWIRLQASSRSDVFVA